MIILILKKSVSGGKDCQINGLFKTAGTVLWEIRVFLAVLEANVQCLALLSQEGTDASRAAARTPEKRESGNWGAR